ncbi:glycosyltransferase involved in cell wall biosynthesis [Bradyrhizobium sp. i1.15.2]|uniref:glycosyltransferase family 4 protein n=1 Tax=Bradyrhizobium sp. i1.15.2 TaxID=3156362 RepID=UPI003391711B
MNIQRRFIVVIGQIPPPTDGLAYITAEYVKLLAEDHDIVVLNISPKGFKRGIAYHLSRTAAVLRASIHLAINAWRKNRVCYMPCQSDFGLIYTIYLLALARLMRYPSFLHHHNFGYINEKRRMMEFALRTGGPKTVHIFLCDHMRRSFGETYWMPERAIVVSNIAFVPTQAGRALPTPKASLRVGLLSNLNREKGLYLFLDLLRAARDQGLNIHGTLAGPLREAEDQLALEAAQQELGNLLTYTGPLFGDAKLQFYESIDVFVFPTIYANEAQPTVLYEAMAAGNAVISYERGCISSQVGNCGLVIAKEEPFVPAACEWLREFEANCERTASRRAIARKITDMHAAETANAREALLRFLPY